MARKIARCVITLLGAVIFMAALDGISTLLTNSGYAGLSQVLVPWAVILVNVIAAAVGGVLFFFIAPSIISAFIKLGKKCEAKMSSMSLSDISFAVVGVIVGLVVAYLLTGITRSIGYWPAELVLNIGLYLLLGYMGWHFVMKRRKEINVPSIFRRNRDKSAKTAKTARIKVLDSSAIIDGRVVDVAKTGVLEGGLVIPSFVASELHRIADSMDMLKRNRGRRGLDLITDMQNDSKINVSISEVDYDDMDETDMKLIRFALENDAVIITNDYSLNKAAAVQKVAVLNINDLSNAVKPTLIAGEVLEVVISKEGKEVNQGVAYLDDGTMIVVEGGSNKVGEKLTVTVTSVLQTSAGRMIFAKTLNEENQ